MLDAEDTVVSKREIISALWDAQTLNMTPIKTWSQIVSAKERRNTNMSEDLRQTLLKIGCWEAVLQDVAFKQRPKGQIRLLGTFQILIKL